MKYILLMFINACLLAYELTPENVTVLTQEISKIVNDPWIFNSDIRYSIDGKLSNDKGIAIERIIKPGMVQIKAIRSVEITFRKEKDNDIDMISIRIFSFQNDDFAADLFSKKWLSFRPADTAR